MKYTGYELINLDTNNYIKKGNSNPHFVTVEDYEKSNTEQILKGLLNKVESSKFNLLDLTSGSRFYSKQIITKFENNISDLFLNDLNDFYQDNSKYENIFNYNILKDDFSSIVEQNINNFIVFLNPYISTKNCDHYAIQGSKLKASTVFKQELKKSLDLLKDKKFIFIFNSTKTDIYFDIFKELFNSNKITPNILKSYNVSLYGKEDGYLFLTNITQGQYETEENIRKNKNINNKAKKQINLLKNREDFYSFISKIIENK